VVVVIIVVFAQETYLLVDVVLKVNRKIKLSGSQGKVRSF
jgi:hypothetical protein